MRKMALAWIAVLLLWASSVAGQENCRSMELGVSVYNEAGVPAAEMAKAEAATKYVLGRAGLLVAWTNRSGQMRSGIDSGRADDLPMRLYIHILQLPRGSSGDVFGMAFVSPDAVGSYIDVFYGPIQALSYQRLSSGELLGYVIAHEIGHLLLGMKSHSGMGIMTPHWGSGELREASMGQLLFSAAQSSQLRAKLRPMRILANTFENFRRTTTLLRSPSATR